MRTKRIPAETFPPGVFLHDELIARRWTVPHLAMQLPGDFLVNLMSLELLIYAPQKGMLVGKKLSAELGRAFGVDKNFFLRLDEAWQKSDE